MYGLNLSCVLRRWGRKEGRRERWGDVSKRQIRAIPPTDPPTLYEHWLDSSDSDGGGDGGKGGGGGGGEGLGGGGPVSHSAFFFLIGSLRNSELGWVSAGSFPPPTPPSWPQLRRFDSLDIGL